ncbi:MAG: hypothetical protein NUV69_02110 [Candidatus Curtissbacteria bacterium]|nr:hypothetical protein [Candidatus Curtissbacteria bacterium]
MPVSKSVLGMNARNFLYIRKYNLRDSKKTADNKLATKRILIREGIPTTRLIKAFSSRKSITKFDWDLPKGGFVVKPARGYGGEGVLVFKNWKGEFGETLFGEDYDTGRLASHILDIIEGVYSLQFLPDRAFIEERVRPHPFFKKIAPGLADIRVIVFNKVPIMAMLRLPTAESKGRANLHFGAIGVGIDLRTGITKHAIYKNRSIRRVPGTKIKTRGIKIPNWDEILEMAVQAQAAIEGLGFAGVDMVVDIKRGPLVLEINSRPGLSIQNANQASLRSRLERVENVEIPSIERGIELAKSLYAEDSLEKVKVKPVVLSVIEEVMITTQEGVTKSYHGKMDSGAYRTSIDYTVVAELKLPILTRKILIKSASGQQLRDAVRIRFNLGGKIISTVATIAQRAHLEYPIIVGRKDLKGFLIDPKLMKEDEEEKVS